MGQRPGTPRKAFGLIRMSLGHSSGLLISESWAQAQHPPSREPTMPVSWLWCGDSEGASAGVWDQRGNYP